MLGDNHATPDLETVPPAGSSDAHAAAEVFVEELRIVFAGETFVEDESTVYICRCGFQTEHHAEATAHDDITGHHVKGEDKPKQRCLSQRQLTNLRYYHERVQLAYEKYEADPSAVALKAWAEMLKYETAAVRSAIGVLEPKQTFSLTPAGEAWVGGAR